MKSNAESAHHAVVVSTTTRTAFDHLPVSPTLGSLVRQAIPADKVVVPIPADFVMAESVHELMRQLTALVYAHGDERTKARASICATYMRCIHDDFYTARDMLLMSHLQVGVPPRLPLSVHAHTLLRVSAFCTLTCVHRRASEGFAPVSSRCPCKCCACMISSRSVAQIPPGT